jgi:hypothetical protein
MARSHFPAARRKFLEAVGYDNNLKIKNNGCGEAQVHFLYVILGAQAGGNGAMAICLTSMYCRIWL